MSPEKIEIPEALRQQAIRACPYYFGASENVHGEHADGCGICQKILSLVEASLAHTTSALEKAERDTATLDALASCILDDYFEYNELDRFDMEDFLKGIGLIVDATVTEADCEDGWPGDLGLDVGGACLKISERGDAAIRRTALSHPQKGGSNARS